MPLTVAGGAGSRGAEHLASALVDLHVKQGWLASLDYSLGSRGGHATARNASRLCNALCFQWNHQRRLLQWQQDILARPLETAVAIPQGDALSPLALGVYMYAGLRFVEVQTPEKCSAKATFHLHG